MKLFDFKWMLPALGDYFTFYGGGKGSAPPAPDYVGAAQQTAAGNLEAARATAAANRTNQITPYGNLTYTANPGTDPYGNTLYTATQTLAPDQQALLNQTTKLNTGLLGTAQSGLDYANQVLSQPGVDTSKLAQIGINPGQSYQDAIMARLSPQLDRENAQLEQQLANRGIAAGTDAYNQAKQLQAQNQNDRLNSAVVQGMNTGLAANQQGFQQQAYNQMQPINVINALRTGSQVQNPNFVNTPQQANTAGPDILGATNAQYQNQLNAYNAQQAAGGGFLGGLMNLGGTLGSAYIKSDRKLKKDIKRIGTHDLGIGIYTYHYKDGHDLPKELQVGVMADEVETIMPEAVITMADGYKAVNYALI
jgi:Chaperone of endosialidase